ncbi:MAG: 16S rRNA (uracil(1498)-N(3))-methyltransferase [Candidatus Thiodiazotropha sp. 6PLUC2]
MRIPRCYTTQPLTPHQPISLEDEPAHHLRHVLRMRTGNQIILFDNSGDEFQAHLDQVSRQGVSALVGEQIRHETETQLVIHLIIGISRGERMDLVLQKATELGVTHITPSFTQRCVVKLDDKKRINRMAHWQRVIVSACEQSGRCRLPMLDEPVELSTAISQHNSELALVLDPAAIQPISKIPPPKSSVSILIGPEGGLSDNERDQAIQQGFLGLRLGPRILRTETAPLAAIAAIQTLWGDFKF